MSKAFSKASGLNINFQNQWLLVNWTSFFFFFFFVTHFKTTLKGLLKYEVLEKGKLHPEDNT